MGKLEEIRQKIREGKKPKDLVKEGYPKSSVYTSIRIKGEREIKRPTITLPRHLPGDKIAITWAKIGELEEEIKKLEERIEKHDKELRKLTERKQRY